MLNYIVAALNEVISAAEIIKLSYMAPVEQRHELEIDFRIRFRHWLVKDKECSETAK